VKTILRAIIIDDEKSGVNSLRLLIERFIPDVKVVATATKPEQGIELIEDYRPEIVFLDIKMPGLNGFELLDRLTFRGFNLIFTTAYQEYAVKAIKSNALDYLLKPIDIEDLEKTIERVRLKGNTDWDKYKKILAELGSMKAIKILLPGRDKVEYVNVNDIVRLESISNYTIVHILKADKITVAKPIIDFENQLCNSEFNFMRVHRSHIINLHYVQKFLKEDSVIVLADKHSAPLSKNKKEEFMKWLNVS
jgi:two-component system LytT family response regulator